jgi:hypothetical protein
LRPQNVSIEHRTTRQAFAAAAVAFAVAAVAFAVAGVAFAVKNGAGAVAKGAAAIETAAFSIAIVPVAVVTVVFSVAKVAVAVVTVAVSTVTGTFAVVKAEFAVVTAEFAVVSGAKTVGNGRDLGRICPCHAVTESRNMLKNNNLWREGYSTVPLLDHPFRVDDPRRAASQANTSLRRTAGNSVGRRSRLSRNERAWGGANRV